jgi:hypothetical protein
LPIRPNSLKATWHPQGCCNDSLRFCPCCPAISLGWVRCAQGAAEPAQRRLARGRPAILGSERTMTSASLYGPNSLAVPFQPAAAGSGQVGYACDLHDAWLR